MEPENSHSPSGPLFWALLAVGWGIIAFGLWGTVEEANRTRPSSFAPWFIGSALVHDLLVAPAVFLLGVAIVRVVPGSIRRFVQAGLIISSSVVAISLPLLIGLGGQAGNPSALPHNYRAGVVIVLGAVWAAIAAVASVKRSGSRH